MPRAKKPNWDRVTITLSQDCITALRVLSAISGREMGEEADTAMRDGKLFERLAYAQGKPFAYTAPAIIKPPVTPPTERKPTPATEPISSPKQSKQAGDSPLFHQIETLITAGNFTQADLAKALNLKSGSAAYRDWRKRGSVPANHVPGVVAFLREKGIQAVTT